MTEHMTWLQTALAKSLDRVDHLRREVRFLEGVAGRGDPLAAANLDRIIAECRIAEIDAGLAAGRLAGAWRTE
jgi:hypothetical protein